MLGSLQFGYNTGVINAPQKVSVRQAISPSQNSTPPVPENKLVSAASPAKIVHPARQLTACNGICEGII